ncbi:hypothetical protein niasHS_012681 [Heterodera schachtii]|uniref:Chromo domain-containing protein n=1 Tax=Heterodera schachtii TaxID=97005 RepID=A0ABD2IU86_HETSC
MGKRSGAKANEARKKKRANQTSSKNSETTKKILCTHKPRAVLEKQKQQQRRQQQHTIPAEPVPNENATNEQQQQPNNINNNTNNATNEQQQQPNITNNNTNNGTVEQQPLQHQPHGNNLPPMPNINNNNNGTNPQIASPNRLNFERDDEQQSEDNESGQSDESELGQDDESVELEHNNGSQQLDEAMPEEDNTDETVENDMGNQQQQHAQTEGAEMPMEVPDEPCYELSSILAVFTDGKGDRAYFVKWKAYRNYEWVLGTDMFGLEMAVDFTGTSSAICTMDALEGKTVPKTHLQFLLDNQQFRRLAARLKAHPTESERDIMWAYKITTTQKKSAEKQLEPFIRRFMQ